MIFQANCKNRVYALAVSDQHASEQQGARIRIGVAYQLAQPQQAPPISHSRPSDQTKRGFYSGSAEIVWLQPILFAWLLKGRSCSSERARLHRWPSGWQTLLAIFKRTQSAYKPIDLLDLLYLAQKFASAFNRRPSSQSSLAASLSS